MLDRVVLFDKAPLSGELPRLKAGHAVGMVQDRRSIIILRGIITVFRSTINNRTRGMFWVIAEFEMPEIVKTGLAHLTSEIAAAYVAGNSVPAAELPRLISSIRQTLGSLGKAPDPVVEAERPKPAVPIKKSVTDDYLISLFDGRRFKSLKRHLMAEYKVNPDEYRAMFGLPKSYPMVAPGYAKERSNLAKSNGLGRKPAVTAKPEAKKNAAE